MLMFWLVTWIYTSNIFKKLVTLYVWRWSIDWSWTLDRWSCSYQVWSNKHLIISDHWLVVWNMAGLWLSIYWECHDPNWWTHIYIYFSEGYRYTTNPIISDHLYSFVCLEYVQKIQRRQESLGHLPPVGPFGAQQQAAATFFLPWGKAKLWPETWPLDGRRKLGWCLDPLMYMAIDAMELPHKWVGWSKNTWPDDFMIKLIKHRIWGQPIFRQADLYT